MKKEYIGDGVYVEFDPGMQQLILSTDDPGYGHGRINTIYVNIEVYASLMAYAKQVFNQDDQSQSLFDPPTEDNPGDAKNPRK